MKKIGFIDYYIDEWHARNYPAWIRKCSAGAFDVALAWEEKAKPEGKPLAQWCIEQSVGVADSIEQVVRDCDAIIVLSPDNMERHEDLADLPLRSGKPVYVDKTFAPSAAAAKRMQDKAKKHGTPMFSSSALRFSPDLAAARRDKIGAHPVRMVLSRGPNDFKKQYAVHTFETMVMLLGTGAKRVMQTGTALKPVIAVDYGDGRRGVAELCSAGFELFVEYGEKDGVLVPIKQDFWSGPDCFIPNLLKFFETGKPPVQPKDTLAIMALIEAGTAAVERPYEWVPVPKTPGA